MDNYIGKIDAEWVDPAVELPPNGWKGLAINSDGDVVYATANVPRVLLGHLVAWLRIGGPSDAIPRAKVQAAVDEMQFKADTATPDTPQEVSAVGIRGSIGCIAHHTGITPTEVPHERH